MTIHDNIFNINSDQAVRRLTALWAFSEAGLGGILHAIEFPFIGLILGSIAMLNILFIFRFSEGNYSTIFRALLLVLLVKITVSPHSGPTAYFAVCFQTILGYVIFKAFKINLFSIGLFFIIGLLQSAFQKLINLTIIYGNEFWVSFENFGEWVLKQFGVLEGSNFTAYALLFYILVHAITGLILALLSINLFNRFRDDNFKGSRMSNFISTNAPLRQKKRFGGKMVWLILLSLIFVAGTTYFFSDTENAWKSVFYITVRTLLVLLLWFGILGPLILHWIRKYLAKKKTKYKEELAHLFSLLPYYPSIIKYAFQQARMKSMLKRPTEFLYHLIRESLMFETRSNP